MTTNHYVDKQQFSLAVAEYVKKRHEAETKGDPVPVVPDYVAECFLLIARRKATAKNYSSYTWKEEMIMDSVENCLRAVKNYNISTPTRGGVPNAFGYFDLIITRAFHRRIAKEKRQQEIKRNYIQQSDLSEFFTQDENDETMDHSIIDELRENIDRSFQ